MVPTTIMFLGELDQTLSTAPTWSGHGAYYGLAGVPTTAMAPSSGSRKAAIRDNSFHSNYPLEKGASTISTSIHRQPSGDLLRVISTSSSIHRWLSSIEESSKVNEGTTCKGEDGVENFHLPHLRKVIIQSSIFCNSFHRQALGSKTPSQAHSNSFHLAFDIGDLQRLGFHPFHSTKHISKFYRRADIDVAFNYNNYSVDFLTLLVAFNYNSKLVNFLTLFLH